MSALISEETLRTSVFLLVRLVEAAGALVIFSGASLGFVRFVWTALVRRNVGEFNAVRLVVGRFLALEARDSGGARRGAGRRQRDAMSVIEATALALSGAGVVTAGAAAIALRRPRLGLAAALELWTAAGLLRLTAGGSWRVLATAAAIIGLRRVVSAAFRLHH